MKQYSDILEEIEFKIEHLKLNRRSSYYSFSVDISKDTAEKLRNHFKEKGYETEIKMCPQHRWDIIINWSL